MKINDILNERRGAPLYRGMDPNWAADVIRSNEMRGYTTQRYWPDGKRRKDNDPEYENSYWMKGISFTRDLRYAEKWGKVVLIFDQGKLAQRYKFIPFSWGFSIPDENFMDNKNPGRHKREREEFLVTKMTGNDYLKPQEYEDQKLWQRFDNKAFQAPAGKVTNINQYIMGIYIDRSDMEMFCSIRNNDESRHPFVKDYEFLINHPKFLGYY